MKKLLVLLTIFLAPISLFSKNLEVSDSLYTKYVENFGNIVTAQEKSQKYILNTYKKNYNDINKAPITKEQKQFLLASLEYYMGRNYILFYDTQTMINHYKATKTGRFSILKEYYKNSDLIIKYDESAIKKVKKLVSQDYTSDNVLLLEAALFGDICLVKNVGHLILNGPKVGKITNKILKKHPNNIYALMNKAAASIYTPQIWGGDFKKGINYLDQIIKNKNFESASKILKNDVYTGYAMAYGNLGDYKKALSYSDKALKIFPQNIYSLGVRKLIESKDF